MKVYNKSRWYKRKPFMPLTSVLTDVATVLDIKKQK